MDVKGQRHRRQPLRTCLADGLLEDLLMPAMDAVEDADSDCGVSQRLRRSLVVDKWYAWLTDGNTLNGRRCSPSARPSATSSPWRRRCGPRVPAAGTDGSARPCRMAPRPLRCRRVQRAARQRLGRGDQQARQVLLGQFRQRRRRLDTKRADARPPQGRHVPPHPSAAPKSAQRVRI